MSFDTVHFAAFFSLVLGVYLLIGSHLTIRNVLFLLASFYFYASWDWRFLSLLIAVIGVNYLAALLLDKRKSRDGHLFSSGSRHLILVIALILTLLPLATFKYAEFIVGTVNTLFFRWQPNQSTGFSLILPIGISFYTFQAIGYTIDVYRGQIKAEMSIVNFATFISFFPQLVAGPIVRARQFLPQLNSTHKFNVYQLYEGSLLIFWGLFKKVFVANNLAHLVDPIFANNSNVSGGAVLIAVYAFAFQIYADFSGYTDIALGCARCLGFELPQNFNLPYLAVRYWFS